jgi:hypothetical protein
MCPGLVVSTRLVPIAFDVPVPTNNLRSFDGLDIAFAVIAVDRLAIFEGRVGTSGEYVSPQHAYKADFGCGVTSVAFMKGPPRPRLFPPPDLSSGIGDIFLRGGKVGAGLVLDLSGYIIGFFFLVLS